MADERSPARRGTTTRRGRPSSTSSIGVTTRGGPDFVPPEERVAIFDNDGTLWCEKPLPIQLDFTLDAWPSMADGRPGAARAAAVEGGYEHDTALARRGDGQALPRRRHRPAAADGRHPRRVRGAHRRCSTPPRSATSSTSRRIPTTGRPYLGCSYQPMVELLRYLEANGFATVHRLGRRPRLHARRRRRPLRHPARADHRQLARARLPTRPTTAPRPCIKAEMEFFDDGPTKPVRIWSRIGRRPVLAGGNSNGDVPMLRFARAATRPALRLLVLHDDAEREFDYTQRRRGRPRPRRGPPTGPWSASRTTGRPSSQAGEATHSPWSWVRSPPAHCNGRRASVRPTGRDGTVGYGSCRWLRRDVCDGQEGQAHRQRSCAADEAQGVRGASCVVCMASSLPCRSGSRRREPRSASCSRAATLPARAARSRRSPERVSPRVFRIVALPSPTEREKSQMYIQRYIPHLPAAGEVVIFDRSWYNRAGVERVMGFCTDEQAERFLDDGPGCRAGDGRLRHPAREVLARGRRSASRPNGCRRGSTTRARSGSCPTWTSSRTPVVRLRPRPRRHVRRHRHRLGAVVRRAHRRQAPRTAEPHHTPAQPGAVRAARLRRRSRSPSARSAGGYVEPDLTARSIPTPF